MCNKEDQLDQGQPVSKAQIALVACCVIVLFGVFACTLIFNLYATG